MNLTKNLAFRRQSWRDSRQDRAEIFATMNLLLGENLGEIRGRIPARFSSPGFLLLGENLGKIRGRIPARFWLPGFLLPGKNLGEIRSTIPARFWPLGFLLPGENLGEIRGRIPARFWPPGISLLAENLAGIPARFPPGQKIPAAKISPGSRREIAAGSRQDPGPYFTRALYKSYTLLQMMSEHSPACFRPLNLVKSR